MCVARSFSFCLFVFLNQTVRGAESGPCVYLENKELGFWGVSGLDKLVPSVFRWASNLVGGLSTPSGLYFFQHSLCSLKWSIIPPPIRVLRFCSLNDTQEWPIWPGTPGRCPWSPCRDTWTSSPKLLPQYWGHGGTVEHAVWSSPSGLFWTTHT